VLLRLALPPFLFLGLTAAHPLAAQASSNLPTNPLFVPSLIQTADDALAGITHADTLSRKAMPTALTRTAIGISYKPLLTFERLLLVASSSAGRAIVRTG